MLTTPDNPYNPFTQETEWTAFDEQMGYYTCNLVARFLYSSAQLQIIDQNDEYNRAVKEAFKVNPQFYKIVEKEVNLSNEIII